MADTIERLRARAAERKTADAAAVHAAARAIAAGGAVPDVGALEAAMAGAGIDVEGFDRLVDRCRERDADRAILARVPDAEARVAKLTATMEKIAAERRRVVEETSLHLGKLEADRAAANTIVADGRSARDRLVRDAPGPVGEALTAARAAHRDAIMAAESLQRTAREQREQADRLEGQAADLERVGRVHPGDIASRRTAAGRAARAAADAEAAMAEADAAVAAAAAAVNRLEADALEA